MTTFKNIHCKRCSGLSLIETIIVLFLVGFMLCACTLSLIKTDDRAKVHGASKTIVTMLRGARQTAITRNAIYLVDFDQTSATASITDEIGNITGKKYFLPKGLFFDKNLDDIQFFPSGRAIKHLGGAAISSIVITCNQYSETADKITVIAGTGRVRLMKDVNNP